MKIIKTIFCKLFGHKLDEFCIMHHNMQVCLRCSDSRGYYDGTNFWTDKEYYGLIGYPIWRLKGYVLSIWIWVKLKIGKLKIGNKYNEVDSDDIPF